MAVYAASAAIDEARKVKSKLRSDSLLLHLFPVNEVVNLLLRHVI